MSQTYAQEKRDLKPRELTEEELKLITESEKEAILKPSAVEGSIWAETEGKYGKYDTAGPASLIGPAPNFYTTLLKALDQSKDNAASHIIYEGFKFGKKQDASIFRSKYNAASASGNKSMFPPKKPKFVEQLFTADVETINAHLATHKEENWELFSETVDGNLVLVKYKA